MRVRGVTADNDLSLALGPTNSSFYGVPLSTGTLRSSDVFDRTQPLELRLRPRLQSSFDHSNPRAVTHRHRGA
jgi:hypothetical protein